LKVILRQTQKETLVMSMYFRGGSTNYSAANAGIESLALSGILQCGTAAYSAGQFDDQVDEYGLHLGGDANNDYGVVKLGCISKYADEAWKLFSSAIASPAFDAQRFNLLKEEKISDLKATLSNPDAKLGQLSREFAFASTNYAINPDGTVASLTALSREDVKNYYYNTLLNKNRMFLIVAGNITKDDLEKKIAAVFEKLPSNSYKPVNIETPFFQRETFKIESRNIATNYIAGIINAPDLSSEDYPAFRLATSLMNGFMFDYIRITKHLSYAPAARMSEGRISYLTLYASTSEPQETVKAMRYILNTMKDNLYSVKTIESLQEHVSLGFVKDQEIMADIADGLGEAEIAGDWRLVENLDKKLSMVTAAEMQAVLKKYAQHITWIYLGEPVAGKASFN